MEVIAFINTLVFILSYLANILSSSYVKSDGEWLAKCIIQGFFISPIEALPEISVTDIVSDLIECQVLY